MNVYKNPTCFSRWSVSSWILSKNNDNFASKEFIIQSIVINFFLKSFYNYILGLTGFVISKSLYTTLCLIISIILGWLVAMFLKSNAFRKFVHITHINKNVNTYEAKASQFNHFDGTYTKKSLSQRWNDFNGIKIQRDMYSAFLIMNINDDLKSFDIDKCNERFENFYRLHNLEVNRLTGNKNLSSIAI